MEEMKAQVQPAATGEKLFTQDEVNAIVGKRLAEQKASGGKELADREAELNRREMALKAKELLAEKGLPQELAAVMKYDDEESLNEAVNLLEKTRGFKKDDPKKEFKVYEPRRLPESRDRDCVGDPIREAFNIERT